MWSVSEKLMSSALRGSVWSVSESFSDRTNEISRMEIIALNALSIIININAHTIDILVYMHIFVIILECAQRAERKMCELEKSKPVTVSAAL